MTITPEADAVKPIPCSLPDPENAYTIAQVRENLIEMEAQLASYPVNLSRGPGWVRQQILSMLDRGIVDSESKQLIANYSDAYAMAENSIVGLEKQRDELIGYLKSFVNFADDRCVPYISTVEDARSAFLRIEREKKP